MSTQKEQTDQLFNMEFDDVNNRLSSQNANGMAVRMKKDIVQFRATRDSDDKSKVQIRIGEDYMKDMGFVAGDSVNIVYNRANSYVGVRKTEGKGLTLTPYHYGNAKKYREQKGKAVTSALNFTVRDGDNLPHTLGETVTAESVICHAAPDTLAFRLPSDSFIELSDINSTEKTGNNE